MGRDPNPTTRNVKTEFQLPEAERDRLDEIAYELSDPHTTVTRSDVLREAVRRYVSDFEDEPSSLTPDENGDLSREVSR